MKNENLRPSDPFDAITAVQDVQLEEITAEVKILVSKHGTSASNEVLASIAWDAFYDACDAWDVSYAATHFAAFFPEFAEFAHV
jgi:hypothetical protein